MRDAEIQQLRDEVQRLQAELAKLQGEWELARAQLANLDQRLYVLNSEGLPKR